MKRRTQQSQAPPPTTLSGGIPLASLFRDPLNPVRIQHTPPIPDLELSENRKLRAKELLPLRWAGTENRLRMHGIPVTESSAYTKQSGIPGTIDPIKLMTDRSSKTKAGPLSLWAPAWAVLVAEADPCIDGAIDWALAHGKDENDPVHRELEALVLMGADRKKMADYLMERWPGD